MEKDIVTNSLIEERDVFADIANVNVLDGKFVLSPKDLEPLPTVTSYKGLEGDNRKLMRDVLMKVKKLGGYIAFIGFESQSGVCNIMPIRDMGYNYTAYMKQIGEIVSANRKNKRSAYTKVLHDNQKLMPTVTYVLYFGNDTWKKPLSIMDMLDIPEEEKEFWSDIINDYRIKVIHMVNQPREIREKYQSDYRVIANYLAGMEDGFEEVRNDQQDILHMEKVLDFLYVYSKDERYKRARDIYMEFDEEEKEEKNNMCVMLDMVEETGIKIGEERGIKIGEERGIKMGEERGRKLGADEKGMQVYINMRNRGMSMEDSKELADIDDELAKKAEARI